MLCYAAWVVLAWLALSFPAQAASFDCKKTQTKVEKMICADAGLSKLDDELTKVYGQVLKKISEETLLKKQQQGWLTARNRCQDISCLHEQYQSRIAVLNEANIFKVAEGRASHITGVSVGTSTNRPKLITEEFFAPRAAQNDYDARQGGRAGSVWYKILLGMGISNPAPPTMGGWRTQECRYDNALSVLEQIRTELGESSAYQKLWAANQDKVFSACDTRSTNDTPPTEPTGKSLPKRAQSDFLYQMATWHFYRNRYDKALEIYQRVENMTHAPLRADAAYMTLRALTSLNRPLEAYNKVDTILADSSLQAVYAIARNYRFIIMDKSRYLLEVTPELAKKHLRWLLSLVRVTPESAANLEQSMADYFDAMTQLDSYFPLYDKTSQSVDWWLTDTTPDSSRAQIETSISSADALADRLQSHWSYPNSPRMQAVKALARYDELVDWMQARWAYNVFDTDWLWALHQSQNPYWKQNQNIVAHAWKRWKRGDGAEWLLIAAKRVHPRDPLSEEILQAALPYLSHAWKTGTPEYKAWLFDLWESLIRIYLGREDFANAFFIISERADFADIFVRYEYLPTVHGQSLEKALRWLVYTGKITEARKCLAIIVKQYPNSFKHWRTLLATNWEEAMTSAGQERWYSDATANSPLLWQNMLNELPASVLYELATSPQVGEMQQPFLARSALTRAILLGYDNDLLDKYAVLAAKLNPSIREALLASMARHDKDEYINFLLRMPRFRPVPYVEYAPTVPTYDRQEKDLRAIDTFNHNDNNWWCRFDQQYLEGRVFKAARILPVGNYFFRSEESTSAFENEQGNNSPEDQINSEFSPYLEYQKELLAQHPYKTLIDTKEISEIEKIPSAPQYLSEAVIAREKMIDRESEQTEEVRNQHAANLHHAVRTTRYGCQRNGSHAAYSKDAFDFLHNQYGGTIWAKATPYWFDCSHFRSRCN